MEKILLFDVGLGFAKKTDILAGKMERSSSKSIQDAANLMRGNNNRARVRSRSEEEVFSDGRDDGMSESCEGKLGSLVRDPICRRCGEEVGTRVQAVLLLLGGYEVPPTGIPTQGMTPQNPRGTWVIIQRGRVNQSELPL
ncbi:hypothetical protein PHJA_000617700 [Phtheirospermum japonicum]|uniref:Uncharacterized protein n=1 Tax=Phtheirospermum japonicum TaxID=374723 RepID=A0A830BHZ7_9LAMI|nr:hypothetical protein PHJA_000617700 [Phtheirospermum japonicum]